MPFAVRALPVLATGLLLLAGCGGGGGDAAAPGTATAPPETLPRGLAPPVTLARTYAFAGRTRRVVTSVVPGTLLDPWRNPAVPLPKGARIVAVQMTWLDKGPDRFPRQWARFQAHDDRGKSLGGAFLGPARGSGRETIQPVGFVVRKARRLARVELTSIVKVWPFRAAWRLPGN